MTAMIKVMGAHPAARIRIDHGTPGEQNAGPVYSVVTGEMILAMGATADEAWMRAEQRLHAHFTGSFLQG